MPILPGKQRVLMLISFSVIYLFMLWVTAVPLFNRSYVATASGIFKLDSIDILSRAYYLNSSKSASKSGLEFEDATRKLFQLKAATINNDEELKSLFDTLQFSKTTVTVYTDKEGSTNYHNPNNDSKISVWYITVGDKSYGNMHAINSNAEKRLVFLLLLSTIVYVILLVVFFSRRT